MNHWTTELSLIPLYSPYPFFFSNSSSLCLLNKHTFIACSNLLRYLTLKNIDDWKLEWEKCIHLLKRGYLHETIQIVLHKYSQHRCVPPGKVEAISRGKTQLALTRTLMRLSNVGNTASLLKWYGGPASPGLPPMLLPGTTTWQCSAISWCWILVLMWAL